MVINMKEINNNITEDYCSFEVIKLLIDKGFDCKVNTYCHFDGSGNPLDEITICPTHQLAISWLRENFNLHISSDFDSVGWFYVISHLPCIDNERDLKGQYKTSEEAIESALLFTLNELI